MNLIIKSVFILLFCDQFNRCLCSVWEKSKCSADEEQHMPEGMERNVGRFPWLGIIQHSFMVGDKRAYVITGAVLIHSVYAIAAADDVSKINPDTLANTTELIFWKDSKQKYALPVEDYVLHPEYTQGVTTATIALVSIINPNLIGFSDFVAPVTPVCMPLSGIGTYEDMYAVKFTDVTGDLQKEVIKMNYVGTTECEQFYIESELQYDKMNPTNPLCAVSVNTSSACIWDSGAALITRQSWGFWQLIGFATRGPGCGAPAKFLNIIHYMPWINDIIQSAFSMDTGDEDSDSGENVLGFRRLSPTKLVFYGKSVAHPRYFGACGKEERGRTLYKESARIFCNQPSTGYYLVSVTASASFFCGEVYLRSIARTNAVMWLENHCRRDMEERALFQYRTGDLERIECFLYFKTTAYLEFKFIFALEAEFYVAMYGQYSVPKQVDPIWNPPITTSWWPTWVHRYVCFVWDKMPCSADEEQTMEEGIVKNTGRFPWLGVLQHSFDIGDRRNYAITGAVLVHPAFAIAAAEDVARIDPIMLENNTELIFWTAEKQKSALTVKDYMLHPEFTEGITTATIALVSIVARYEGDFSEYMAPVKPVCMPMAGIGGYVNMYVAKLTDVTGELQKETFKMNTVDKKECDQFYLESQLHYDKMNPTNPLCASSTNSTDACIWDSGTALISRQSWGFWQLVGFAVRGPGCSAPTKFLSIVDYLPWMNDVIRSVVTPDADDDSEGDLTLGLRRLAPTKLVFFPGTTVLPRYLGDCAPEARGRTLFRDTSLFSGNKDFVQGYYLASVTQHASFFCGEVNLRVQRRTNAVMWVENHCFRAGEERALGQARTGDVERLECFKYFRSTAYIEFKFIFSFYAEFTIAMYGKLDYRQDANPFKYHLHTTNWWPTWGKIAMRYFQREGISNAWSI